MRLGVSVNVEGRKAVGYVDVEALRGLGEGLCFARLAGALRGLGGCRGGGLRGASASHKGPRRNNEDGALVVVAGPERGLVAVADGVGGLDKGEVASHLAICTLLSLYPQWLEGQLSPEEWLRDAFITAHEVVARAGRGGATTLTVALVRGDDLYVANVGDSPLYLLDARGFRRVTGELDEEGEYITQAVGHRTYRGPHIYSERLVPPAAVVAVTDGVDDVLRNAYGQALGRDISSPYQLARSLVCHALRRGTRDNATAAVLVKLATGR